MIFGCTIPTDTLHGMSEDNDWSIEAAKCLSPDACPTFSAKLFNSTSKAAPNSVVINVVMRFEGYAPLVHVLVVGLAELD